MLKKIIKFNILVVACLLLTFAAPSSKAWAQQPNQQLNTERTELKGTRKQIATIIFAGLAGAILGLSTLSFYGRPQDNLSNIAVGFAVGVIGGTIYTTYKAATNPYEAYYMGHYFDDLSQPFAHLQPERLQFGAKTYTFRTSVFQMSF